MTREEKQAVEAYTKELQTRIMKAKNAIHYLNYGTALDYLSKPFPILNLNAEKPSSSIYWHKIKFGESLPCAAYLWPPEFERVSEYWQGRLIPTIEGAIAGADIWYLPVKDIVNLEKEK